MNLENKETSKRITLPYGVYYVQVLLMDIEGESVSNIFKVWAYPDSQKCAIRHVYFYERWMLSWNDSLGMGITLPSGIPKNSFDPKYYRSQIQKLFRTKE